jgi:MYXO-CTERM domain-containing protein
VIDMKSFDIPARLLALAATTAAGVVTLAAPTVAHADTAADAFNAWNNAFLVRQNGLTYYATTVTTAGTVRQGTWVGALDIAIAEDRYMFTHSAADRQLVSDLMTTFVAKEGTTWINNSSWNDDMAWMIIAGLRAYQIVGNEAWLKIATDAWNGAYDRGWDTKYAGGGIWEDMGHITPWNKPSKCGLSNNPIVSMGVVLYQITGDQTYLDKAKQIYAWSRKSMFVAATGQVYGCVGFPSMTDTVGALEGGNNAYDSGSFTEMSDALYRVTGDDAYHQDTLLAVNYRVNKDAIMHDGGRGERQWGYRFTRGLSDFCTFNDQWSKYQTWLQNNANAAWSMRNALGVTWDDWTTVTDLPGLPGVTHDNDVVALCTSTAAAIWQQFPPPTAPLPPGLIELRNAGSKLSLKVSGAATTAAASIVQDAFSGGAEALWTFVPTAGSYYQIRNANSGLLLGVSGPTGKQGAGIVQGRDQGLRPGTDRWLPVKNDDGTYAFYNLSSVFALDVPAGSTVSGTQLDQRAGDGTSNQKFELVVHATIANDGGTDAIVADGAAGAGGAPGTGGGVADASSQDAVASGGSGTAGASAGGTSGVVAGGAGAGGSTSSGAGAGGRPPATGGCACRMASASSAASGHALALLGLGVLLARRRRRS